MKGVHVMDNVIQKMVMGMQGRDLTEMFQKKIDPTFNEIKISLNVGE